MIGLDFGTLLTTGWFVSNFMFALYINSIRTLFIVPTDAHYYKIIEMLKQFKIIISIYIFTSYITLIKHTILSATI